VYVIFDRFLTILEFQILAKNPQYKISFKKTSQVGIRVMLRGQRDNETSCRFPQMFCERA